MNKDSSFAKSSREDTQKSEKKCKAFKDISKYFSKEEWAKLGYSDKITYVYMKRNYDTMTGLGNRKFGCRQACEHVTIPQSLYMPWLLPRLQQKMPLILFICDLHIKKVMLKTVKEEEDSDPIPITPGFEQAQKVLCLPGKASTSDQQSEIIPGPKRGKNSIWAYRLRERKNLVVYEEISDPEEED
uniref:KRAB-related domain-containing protein n=1 Tax=Canis lupus dingo TaxID=286419 RepID=A0A8C0L9H5_CANLU